MRSVIAATIVATVMAVPSWVPSSTADAQCCVGKCPDSNTNKYFSIADDSGPWLCGETCIRDSFYWVFHLFEKNLTKATDMNTCKDAGYTEYKETVTHGGGGLDCTLDLYACSKAGGCEHPGASAASVIGTSEDEELQCANRDEACNPGGSGFKEIKCCPGDVCYEQVPAGSGYICVGTANVIESAELQV